MTRWWRIVREPSQAGATLGGLYLDGVWFSWTLEDTIREVEGQPVSQWKQRGITAIPQGAYKVKLTFSQKFQRMLPELLDVPGFDGIRIHAGNRSENTEGCVLVGFQRANAALTGGTSKPAELAIVTKLQAADLSGDPVWLSIENPPTFRTVGA